MISRTVTTNLYFQSQIIHSQFIFKQARWSAVESSRSSRKPAWTAKVRWHSQEFLGKHEWKKCRLTLPGLAGEWQKDLPSLRRKCQILGECPRRRTANLVGGSCDERCSGYYQRFARRRRSSFLESCKISKYLKVTIEFHENLIRTNLIMQEASLRNPEQFLGR